MSNQLTTQPAKNGFLMNPQSLDEAMRFAEMLAASKLVPSAYKDKPADVLVACQWGAEIGLPPLQALQSIAVINSVPSVWGDAVVGLVRGSGVCEYINQDWDEETKTATCTVKRKGEPEQVRTFSREDANLAGHMNKDTYKKNLRRMLSIRARTFALRDVFADVLRGLKVAEEVMDYPEERDITPAAQTESKPASKAASVLDKVRSRKQEPVAAIVEMPAEPEPNPEQPTYGDEQRAKLNGLIEQMGYCQSLTELKEVANQIAGVGVLPGEELARATLAYKQRAASIKEAMQAQPANA